MREQDSYKEPKSQLYVTIDAAAATAPRKLLYQDLLSHALQPAALDALAYTIAC